MSLNNFCLGFCSGDSIIDIILCFLGFIPGMLYAWYVVAREAERRTCRRDIEQNNPTTRAGYQPIPQIDRTYQQTRGVVQGTDDITYTEATAGSSQPGADNPPSYGSVVKGGILNTFGEILMSR